VASRLHAKEGIVHSSSGQRVWTPSPVRWAKLNTDVGFCIDTGKASTRVVVQDMNGNVLLSTWRSLTHIVSADGNKSLYLVFVGVVFFSASWIAFRAVRTTS
jgi:hypothetical protein